MSSKYGYIGYGPDTSPIVVAKQVFSPTGVQTNFTFAAGYQIGYLDVYLNGARQIEGQDFSATDTSTIGLTTSAQSGDVLELVAYKAYNLAAPTAVGNFTVGGNLIVSGTTTLSAGSSVSFATTSFGLSGSPNITVSGINNTGIATATGGFVGNLTGTASTASFATTSFGLSGSPNITVGTIAATSLNASGVVTATSFSGSGANLTGISSVSFATTSFGLSGTPSILVSSIGVNSTTTNSTKLYVQGNSAGNIVTLTDGATITPDFSLGNNFQVTLAGTRTIANPTGVTTGQSGVIFIQEDGTGGYTVGWGTSWDFASSTAPTLITTASALNALPYFARSTTSIVVGSVISGIGTL